MNVESLTELFRNLVEAGIPSIAALILFILLILTIYVFRKIYIEKKQESRRKIRMMSNLDDLTHLYKRKFFDTLIESELSRAIRHDRNLSCAIIEIDNVDEIKDKYGNKYCDSIIHGIGQIFTDDTRIHDICARYGKYSFATLMPESDIESSIFACNRLIGLIQRSNFQIEETDEAIGATVSIGLVSCKEHYEDDIDVKKVFNMAAKALAMAKEKGGNRVECFSHDIS